MDGARVLWGRALGGPPAVDEILDFARFIDATFGERDDMAPLEVRSALFEQLVRDVDYWCDYALKLSTRPSPAGAGSDVRWAYERLQRFATSDADRRAIEVVCHDTLFGLIHSILVSIDGGSRLADTARVDLVTEDGASLGPGLHELFFDYLAQANLLPQPPDSAEA